MSLELNKQDVRHLAIDACTKMEFIRKWYDFQAGTRMDGDLTDACFYIREFIDDLETE